MFIPLWFTTVEGAKITSGLFWSRTNCSSWSEPCESLCGSYGTPFTSLMSPWPRHLVKFSAFFSIKFVMNLFHSRPRTASHDSAVMCLATHFLAGALLRSLGQIWFPRDLVGIMHISENGIRTKWYNTNYADGLSCARWNEANAPIWLASWEGKMGMSCPLSVPQEQMSFGPVNEFFVDQDGFDIDIDFWLFFSVLKAPKKNLANNCPLIRLNPRAGKMKRILYSDWLPTLVPQENFTFWPYKPLVGLYLEGRFNVGFFCVTSFFWGGGVGRLIFGGVYTWKGLFSEFYGILHYEWRIFYPTVINTD